MRYILDFDLALIFVDIFYLYYTGSHSPIFYASDFHANFVGNGLSNNVARIQAFEIAGYCPAYLCFEAAVLVMGSSGSVGIKVLEFILNLSQLENWWLFGNDFRAPQQPEKVLSTALLYDDPGLIQLIFMECGLLAGILFLYLIFRSILIS